MFCHRYLGTRRFREIVEHLLVEPSYDTAITLIFAIYATGGFLLLTFLGGYLLPVAHRLLPETYGDSPSTVYSFLARWQTRGLPDLSGIGIGYWTAILALPLLVIFCRLPSLSVRLTARWHWLRWPALEAFMFAVAFGVFSIVPWALTVELDVWFMFASAGFSAALALYWVVLSLDKSMFASDAKGRFRGASLGAMHRKWIQLAQILGAGFVIVMVAFAFQSNQLTRSAEARQWLYLVSVANTVAVGYLVAGYGVLVFGAIITKLARIEELLNEAELNKGTL